MIIVKFIVRNSLYPTKTFLLTDENLLPGTPTCGNIEDDLQNFLASRNNDFAAIHSINRQTFRQYGDDLFLVFDLLVSANNIVGHKWVSDSFIEDSSILMEPADRFFILQRFI